VVRFIDAVEKVDAYTRWKSFSIGADGSATDREGLNPLIFDAIRGSS
jgi:hypothetical protein